MLFLKRAGQWICVLLISLLLAEIVLRAVSVRSGHIQFLFGEKARYLVPFDVPSKFPETASGPGVYRVYDKELGWTLGKLGAHPPLYYSDAKGYRTSKQQYESEMRGIQPAPAAYDIVAIGDSFTHGEEVLYEQSWPHLLGEKLGKKVLNLGVGGYGLDQAVLRYQKEKIKSRFVLLGLISGDLERSLTQFYSFKTGGLKTKPLFSFDSGTRILNVPCLHGRQLREEFLNFRQSDFFANEPDFHPWFLEKSFFDRLYTVRFVKSLMMYRRDEKRQPVYIAADERLSYCFNILNYLNDLAADNGAKLAVVLLDNNSSFLDRRRGIDDPWKKLKEKLNQAGIKFINPEKELCRLYEANRDRIINPEGVHYTLFANEEIASFIARDPLFKADESNQ